MALISVIVPAYNSEKTIRETIESVLNQTFSDFELIAIDDGSTDSTSEIISKIQDSRLKLFCYDNAGSNVSRNRGISHATGEFISFLDADDIWTSDKLEAQLKALQENSQAAVAYSWTDYIDDKSQFLRPGTHVTVVGDVYEKLLVTNFLENGSNPLIRAHAFTEVGNFDESLPAAQDWDMWLRLAACYHFVAVPSAQILYRISANSLSSNLSRQEKACLQVMERAFDRAPASLQHLKKQSVASLYSYLMFRALEGPPTRQKGLVAARCFWYSLRNDPSWLRRRKVLSIVLFKIVLATLLPHEQSQAWLNTFKRLYKEQHLFSKKSTSAKTLDG